MSQAQQQRSLKEMFEQEIFSNNSSAFKGKSPSIMKEIESRFDNYEYNGQGDFSLTSPEHLEASRLGSRHEILLN
jgi:hypothetical protein